MTFSGVKWPPFGESKRSLGRSWKWFVILCPSTLDIKLCDPIPVVVHIFCSFHTLDFCECLMPGKSEPNIFSEMVGFWWWWVPWNKVKNVTKKTQMPKLSKDKAFSCCHVSLLLVKKAGRKRSSSTHTKHHKTLEVKDQQNKSRGIVEYKSRLKVHCLFQQTIYLFNGRLGPPREKMEKGL